MIQGYTGHVSMWRNRSPYRQPFVETADQVFATRIGLREGRDDLRAGMAAFIHVAK